MSAKIKARALEHAVICTAGTDKECDPLAERYRRAEVHLIAVRISRAD